VAVAKLSGEAQPDAIDYTIRVENHSGYALRQIVVRAEVPSGTSVLLEGLGQPDGVDAPTLENGQLVWKARTLPAHAILGPFTFTVLTAGLPGRLELVTTATVAYAHGSPPLFRGTSRSAEARVQVSNR
jgi:hypothetical protein